MTTEDIDRYISLMYNKASGLNHIEDLQDRKRQAAALANLDLSDQEVIDMMDLKNEDMRVKIVHYLNRWNPNDYIKLISDQQLFWNLQQRLMKPLQEEDDINKLIIISEKSVELVERIKDGYNKVYRQKEFIEKAQETIRMISPEMRIRGEIA